MQIIKDKPWIPFLILALVTQQTCLLTYKYGAAHSSTYVFMTYSFAVQCVVNIILTLMMRKRGFPVQIPSKMRLWVVFVTALYLLNELTLITVYHLGAPFALMTAVFSLASLMILLLVSVVFLKENIPPRKMLGIALAIAAILLIKLG